MDAEGVRSMSNLTMEVISATLGQPRAVECAATWGCAVTWVRDMGLVEAYQAGFEQSTADVLVYAHDDTILREPWQDRICGLFENDAKIGVIGLGGALQHGDPEMYRTPYKLQQLGRGGYISNSDDAEGCGERFAGSREVAVVDGFFMAIRREVLRRAGGWPIGKIAFHNYDYWSCCIARRLGYTTWMTGLRCAHLGGASSVGLKADDGLNHAPAHAWIYQEFKDVLPFVAVGRAK